jgi:hypothetical protein
MYIDVGGRNMVGLSGLPGAGSGSAVKDVIKDIRNPVNIRYLKELIFRIMAYKIYPDIESWILLKPWNVLMRDQVGVVISPYGDVMSTELPPVRTHNRETPGLSIHVFSRLELDRLAIRNDVWDIINGTIFATTRASIDPKYSGIHGARPVNSLEIWEYGAIVYYCVFAYIYTLMKKGWCIEKDRWEAYNTLIDTYIGLFLDSLINEFMYNWGERYESSGFIAGIIDEIDAWTVDVIYGCGSFKSESFYDDKDVYLSDVAGEIMDGDDIFGLYDSSQITRPSKPTARWVPNHQIWTRMT